MCQDLSDGSRSFLKFPAYSVVLKIPSQEKDTDFVFGSALFYVHDRDRDLNLEMLPFPLGLSASDSSR